MMQNPADDLLVFFVEVGPPKMDTVGSLMKEVMTVEHLSTEDQHFEDTENDNDFVLRVCQPV